MNRSINQQIMHYINLKNVNELTGSLILLSFDNYTVHNYNNSQWHHTPIPTKHSKHNGNIYNPVIS